MPLNSRGQRTKKNKSSVQKSLANALRKGGFKRSASNQGGAAVGGGT